MTKKNYIFPYNKKRAVFALVNSSILSVLMFTGLVMRLLSKLPEPGYYGTGAFRMFTTDSNLLVGICVLLSIPYQIDGIVTGNYHMPRWIIYTLYIGVSAVSLTMVTTICVLGPGTGFDKSLFTSSNLIFHLINPALSILLFVLVTCEHKVKMRYSVIAMIPVILYALVYIVMVFIIGKDNGGWADHYKAGAYIPWPISIIVLIAMAFGICTGIRVLHNLVNTKQEKWMKENYQNAMRQNNLNAKEAVIVLAKENKHHDPFRATISIPRQIIYAFNEVDSSMGTVDELCELYLKESLKDEEI